MVNYALIAAGTVGAALIAWPVVSWYEVSKLEKPSYSTIRTLQNKRRLWYVEPVVQLRHYSPYLVAEVTVESDSLRDALSSGFKQVAGFIFGDNVSAKSSNSEKVAMTSPVIAEQQNDKKANSEKVAMTSPVAAEIEGNRYTVSFVMPSKYDKSTLPKPNNANVKIKEVPAQTFASFAWRGAAPSQEVVDQKKQQLLSVLKQHDISVTDISNTRLWQYYPPFAPSWIRLNEVLLPIEAKGTQDGGRSRCR